MKIELARLYSYTRRDGAVVLSGGCGYNGRLKIEPNPDFDETDTRSAPFLAFIEEKPEKSAAQQQYRGPQLQTPRPMASAQSRSAPALPSSDPFSDGYVEGEVV